MTSVKIGDLIYCYSSTGGSAYGIIIEIFSKDVKVVWFDSNKTRLWGNLLNIICFGSHRYYNGVSSWYWEKIN